MYSFSIRQFICEYSFFLFRFFPQMVDFPTKPSRKMQKNNRAKGVALETPDIKIIMYVYTPLNKVFGFQGSNQIFGGWNCFSIPFLFEPSLKPFLKPSRLFELEAVHCTLRTLQTPNLAWKVLELKKTTRLKWSISLLNPLEKCKKTIVQRGWPWRPLTSK